MITAEQQIAELFNSDYIENQEGAVVIETTLWIHSILHRLYSEGYVAENVLSYKWESSSDTESDDPTELLVKIKGLKDLNFVMV